MNATPRGFFGGMVARPVALFVLFVTLVVICSIAYSRVPLQLMPDGFAEPRIFAWIPTPGASAQENEELVARPVEEQLRTISGIELLRSRSERDSVEFRISFSGATDMNLAKAEVRDRIERAWPSLPRTVETAQIWTESSETLPISFYGIKLSGDADRRDYLMEKVIVPRLDAVQGIGRATVWGMNDDSIRILLDEDKVKAAGIDLGTVIGRLATDNFALPMGEIEDGGREFLVRSDMRFKTPEEIAEFPVTDALKVKDLGRVARVKEVRDQVSRIDGGYAYYGMATKDSQSNVVETSQRFRAAMEELEQDPIFGGDLAFMVFFIQGDMIESALAQLQDTAIQGGVLAIVVLLVFLRRLRLTICVALSIPVSALSAIAWEYFTGGSFNVFTMTGITLATGMLVDNAVVVIENVLRLRRTGMDAQTAAAAGAREIALAVTLASLTSIVVFMPLVFLTEQAALRTIFQSLVIPYSIALMASLGLALFFTPVLVARMSGERSARLAGWLAWSLPLQRLPARAVARLVGALRWIWYLGLRAVHRCAGLALALLVPLRWPLALSALAAAGYGLHSGLARLESARAALDRMVRGEELLARVRAAELVSLSVAGTLAALLLLLVLPRLQRKLGAAPGRPARLVPDGDSLIDLFIRLNAALLEQTLRHRLAATVAATAVLATIAIPASNVKMTAFGDDSSGDELRFRIGLEGRFTLEEAERELLIYEEFLESKRSEYGFAHWSNRFDEDSSRFGLHFDEQKSGVEFDALEKRLKEELPRVAGHRLRFYDQDQSEGNSVSVARFTLLGPDSRELEKLGARAIALLERVPGLSQVTTPLESAPDQIEVAVDRDLAQELGVNTSSVRDSISAALGGFPLPRFQEEGRQVPLRIEFDGAEAAGLPTLADLDVFGTQGGVPLSSVGRVSFAKGARSILRLNGQTSFTLEGKVEDPLKILEVTEAGNRALQELDLPRGYTIDRENSVVRRSQEEMGELMKALALGVFLIFLLMGILFESVMLPFSVLFTIPFAVLGSMWAMLLTGRPMDSIGWIGMIILAGVVVNNGIVLIDRIHVLAAEMPRCEAVLEGSRQRVRPVLMTALTTIVGLVPMMLAEPPSQGIDYRGLATIVAGGLLASTIFTLWIVPLAYTQIDDASRILRERMRWWLRRRAPAPLQAPAAGS